MATVTALAALAALLLQCTASPVHPPRSLATRATGFEGIPDPPPDPAFDAGSGAYATEIPTGQDHDDWDFWWARAQNADSIGENNAARHMFHYLNNTGKDLLFSTDQMMYDQGVLFGIGLGSAVKDLAEAEAEKAYRKATVGNGASVTFRTSWQPSKDVWAVESYDWFLAVGGFSWAVAGVVTAQKEDSGTYKASLRYVVYSVDRYNWDKDKGLLGGLLTQDEKIGRLHKVGLAREYNERGTSKLHVVDPYSPDELFFHFPPPRVGVLPYDECIWEKCSWMDEVRPITLYEAKEPTGTAVPDPPLRPWLFRVRNKDGKLVYSENPVLLDSLDPSGLVSAAGKKTVNTKCIDVIATAGHQTNNEAPLGGLQNVLPEGFGFYFGYDLGEDLNGTPKDACALSLFDSEGCHQANGTPLKTNGIWADDLSYTVFSYQVSNCKMLASEI